MTPRQELGLRSAMMQDDLLYAELSGYSLMDTLHAKHRLTEYFISKSTHVPFEQRTQLIEATMHMLSDLPLDELLRLDQQHFPEHYI